MTSFNAWYVVKQPGGHCEIVSRPPSSDAQTDHPTDAADSDVQEWGPFASQGEAIARRVGLIRAGKCQPI